MSKKASDTKKCPTCKRKFTRQQLRLNERQWFLRIYCSRKCYFKVKYAGKSK